MRLFAKHNRVHNSIMPNDQVRRSSRSSTWRALFLLGAAAISGASGCKSNTQQETVPLGLNPPKKIEKIEEEPEPIQISAGTCPDESWTKKCPPRKRFLLLSVKDCPGQMIGKKAYPLLQVDINPNSQTYGKHTGPQDYLGKVVILNFWSPDCKPCLKEMPGLQKLVDSNKDVVVLAVQTSGVIEDSYGTVLSNRLGLRFPILGLKGKFPINIRLCDNNGGRAPVELFDYRKDKPDDISGTYMSLVYGVETIPVTMIIDREGIVREAFLGIIDPKRLGQIVKKY